MSYARSGALFTLLSVAITGCSSGDSPTSTASGTGGASSSGTTGGGGSGPVDTSPPFWNKKVTPPSDADAAAGRLACKYKKDALPAETQGKSNPSGADIPVDTIIVMMLENRSFDHYFQTAPAAGIDVEVAPSDFQNLDPDGAAVPIFRDDTYCFVDTEHGWPGVHQQINGGMMDGFVTSNDQTHEDPIPGIPLSMMKGNRAMGYYTGDDLPFTYWMAKNFAIGDHYHASVPGPTWPNRMYLYAASSFGRTDNLFPENVANTLMDYLTTRGVPWLIYKSETPCYGIFFDRIAPAIREGKVLELAQFYEDAKAGHLPPVVFVDAGFSISDDNLYTQEDEHPPGLMEYGQRATAKVVDAITTSPQWKRSAMFITYDEHGGLFDHVVPPKACPPDDRKPEDALPGEGFDMLGIRVPFLVVSPYAKKGFVGHRVYDHTSIVRFIEDRFTMPALSNRDANAEAPWEMFDFDHAPNLHPAKVPIPSVDPKKASACKKLWEP